jgi:photosystem II stability/assembly factor-like uncharacterized protein
VRVPHTSQRHRDVRAFVRSANRFLISAFALRSGLRHTLVSRMRPAHLLLALTLATTQAASIAFAQWDIEESHTTASLRGIHNVGGGVAWASGTNGTVLRTEDGGYLWQTCAVPPGAEKLDFRGVQGFDENTAIVMSSGPGDQSRLYKTTDGCQTWKLVFTNPDKDGFWDAIRALGRDEFEVVGDSVDHVLVSEKTGHVIPVWRFNQGDDPDSRSSDHFFELPADPKEGGFAASNSTLVIGAVPHHHSVWKYQWLATQTPDHSYVHREAVEDTPTCEPCRLASLRVETSMSQGSPSAGIFSLAFREDRFGVAVGGDYQKPTATAKIAIYSNDSGKSWIAAQTPPHGYRSSVAYDDKQKLWITVGPNGTDISTDDGKNWRPLTPSGTDPADADKNWNALSLPFVVGPHGRIGRLRTIDQKAAVTKKP